MNHCPGRNHPPHSHLICHFTVGQLGLDVWFLLELVQLMPLKDPLLLGKGFRAVCFGVLGNSWSELWLLHAPSATLWHTQPKPSRSGVNLDQGCRHSSRTPSWVRNPPPLRGLGVPLFPQSFWGNDFSGKNRPRPHFLGSQTGGRM